MQAFLLPPEQTARIKNRLTAYTVGNLQRKLQIVVLPGFIKTSLALPNPADKLKELAELVDNVFQLTPFGEYRLGQI
jgi:hypothetical protein